MKISKLLATGVMTITLVGVSGTTAFAAGTSSPSTTTCPPAGAAGTSPASAENPPRVPNGVSVWHDARGWHVRVTHASLHDRTFSGVVHTSGEFRDVHGVALERNDAVKVGPDKHNIVFRFNNYGRIDGLDFRTSCAPKVEFGFLSDGKRVPTSKISIGRTGIHPKSNPFAL